MRIGIFGGSFDPVHHAHLRLAECCRRQAALDQVVFVPAAHQPLKPDGPVAAPADRAAMLRLAIADQPKLAVSTCELDRGGVSYTVDTLREFRAAYPEAALYFLMGADSLAEFPAWRDPTEICALATPLVVRRPGAPEPDFDALRPLVSAARLAEIRAAAVDMPPTPVSSSHIRAAVAAGEPWQSLVPTAVADYIVQRRLYRTP